MGDTSVSHNSSEQTPDGVTVMAEESQSFKTSAFTRTISPPTLGTLRSCFSWSGSLGDISRTPSPSPSTALQQFRRKSDSSTSLPENIEMSDVAPLKSDESSDESHPLHDVGCSSQSQESMDLSPHNLNASKLSQPSSKDSDSEESDCNFKSLDKQGNQKSKLHLFDFSKKDTLLRNKVKHLHKLLLNFRSRACLLPGNMNISKIKTQSAYILIYTKMSTFRSFRTILYLICIGLAKKFL